MPIDFPSSPTTGQVYTYLGKSWVYNGTGWDVPRSLSEIGAVRTFANAAARTAAIPSPTEGIVSYLNDVDRLDIHNGTTHVPAVSTGAWISYTPTIGNFTFGNGAISARYNVIGKTMFIRIRLQLGSTSSVTGSINISLPSGFTTPLTPLSPIGEGYATITGANLYIAPVTFGTTSFGAFTMNSAGTFLSAGDISSTSPATWVNGSLLEMNVRFEIN
jgi:hypothetical protein